MLDPHALEEELRRLRREGRPEDESTAPYVDLRMVVFNLVVVTFQERLASEAADMLAALASQHPCRALIIHATADGGEAGLSARLAAHCQWSPGGTRQICAEQVFLGARGPTVDHLASIAAPLLLSDLPVIVWWLGVPRPDAVFEQMVDLGDRLLVDSDAFPAPVDLLRRLLEVTRRAARGCAVGDLAWTRLEPWRELVAHCFDGRLAPCLTQIREATVEHGGEAVPTQAVLAAGWLRAQLGLGLPVRIQGIGGQAGLSAIRLRAFDRRRPVYCALERQADSILVETRDRIARTRTVHPLPRAETDLLARALAQYGRDPVYERAVAHAPAPPRSAL